MPREKKRKDEITLGEKDEIANCAAPNDVNHEKQARKDEKRPGKITPFKPLIFGLFMRLFFSSELQN